MTDPKPLTPKQDAWVKAWLANGFNAVDAYLTTYNATRMAPGTIRKEADRVLNAPAVQLRLQELRAENPLVPVAAVHPSQRLVHPNANLDTSKPEKPDKAWLLNAALDVWRMSLQTGNLGQAKATLELIGKLTGDLVDRKELRVVRSWSDLSDAEVDALAAGETIDAEIIEEEQSTDAG